MNAVTISLPGRVARFGKLLNSPTASSKEDPLSPTPEITRDSSSPQPLTARSHWCLFLDVDGTLLEIAPTPDAVRVEDSLKQLLQDVRDALEGAVALVSGRDIAALDRLFAPGRWPAAGLHGLERRDAAGTWHRRGPARAGLDAARHALAAIAAGHPGVLLEDKGLSLAVHYRAVPDLASALQREIQPVMAKLGPEYHVLEGKCVLEIKPVAATKADAVRTFMTEAPFAGRRPIYVGDDVTDLDGFAAVESAGGLSVAVGDRVQAQARVASPRDVRSLLADLADGRSPQP